MGEYDQEKYETAEEEPQEQRRSSFGMEVPYPNLDLLPEDDEETPQDEEDAPPRSHLTRPEIWNLFFCVLAWACTIANVTLVVGTSNVVLLSIDGDPNLSSLPLATFFMGASLVSLLVTPWHFEKLGRKRGLQVGVVSGLVGTTLGCLAVFYHSTPLLIVATAAFGAAMGIGFYLRFAAVEMVPLLWADKAVTLVVSGGCIAAFAGPESAEGTRGMFGDDYEYMGVFLMTGVFNLANGVFTFLVRFPDVAAAGTIESPPKPQQDWQQLVTILRRRHFVIPMLISAGSWSIMALPMSVLRVAMHEVGFTSRQSLITIELHFLGMFAPGFVSGQWIARYGPRLVSMGAASVFWIAVACLQLTQPYNSESSSIALWIAGMVLIGVGWNCGFSASTVGSTRSYARQPHCKSAIQAANDGGTFLLAGAIISCASFIYQAGGEGLEGWRTVNWVVMGFIGVFCLLLAIDFILERGDAAASTNPSGKWSTPSMALNLQADG